MPKYIKKVLIFVRKIEKTKTMVYIYQIYV